MTQGIKMAGTAHDLPFLSSRGPTQEILSYLGIPKSCSLCPKESRWVCCWFFQWSSQASEGALSIGWCGRLPLQFLWFDEWQELVPMSLWYDCFPVSFRIHGLKYEKVPLVWPWKQAMLLWGMKIFSPVYISRYQVRWYLIYLGNHKKWKGESIKRYSA